MHKQWLGVWVHDPHDADHLEHHDLTFAETRYLQNVMVIFPPNWPYKLVVTDMVKMGASLDMLRAVGVTDDFLLHKYLVKGTSADAIILASNEQQALKTFSKLCCGLDRIMLENPYETPCV